MGDHSTSIITLFLNKKELSFADIEKALGIRSNHLAYYLKQLVDKEILEKDERMYRLTKSAETLLPYMNTDKQFKLPVVVLAIEHDNKFAFIYREKRPYADHWAMPGGRVFMNETIEEAAKRIAITEAQLEITDIQTCAVIDEHLVDDERIKNSWMMFLIKAKVATNGTTTVNWVSENDLDDVKIIPSDVWMIKNLRKENLKIHHVRMEDVEKYVQAFAE